MNANNQRATKAAPAVFHPTADFHQNRCVSILHSRFNL